MNRNIQLGSFKNSGVDKRGDARTPWVHWLTVSDIRHLKETCRDKPMDEYMETRNRLFALAMERMRSGVAAP